MKSAVCIAIFAALAASTADADGDRHPSERRVFPQSAFYHSGCGRQLVDVTKPPFCAKGDGIADDTAALCRAMRFVREMNPLYSQTNGNVFCCQSHKANWAIYLPRGTYRVTDTISQGWPALGLNNNLGWNDIRPILVLDSRHDGRLIELERTKGEKESYFAEANWAIRVIGESRDDTVIRLDDNAAGFGRGAKKPVLAFCLLAKGSNVNLGNFLENLTVDAGHGNVGAVGVRWNSSNFGGIRNVTIKSAGGALGLDMGYRNACGYVRDITIDGFSVGADLSAGSETTVVIEHSTIRNAELAFSHRESYHGVFDLLNVRKVVLENVATHWLPAKGFRMTVKDCSFAPDTRPGLVAAEDVPVETYPALCDIATPEEFGAKGDGETDDTEAVRLALASGKKAVFFLGPAYVISRPIDVPASVQCIDGMHSYLKSAVSGRMGVFRVAENAKCALEVRRFYFRDGIMIDHVADRLLSVTDVFTEFPPARLKNPAAPSWYTYRNATPSVRKRVFATDCVQFCAERTLGTDEALENVDLQARSLNNETSITAAMALRACRAFMFGVKSENSHTCLDMENSVVDAYGVTYLQWAKKGHWEYPIVRSAESRYSADFYLWRTGPMQPIICRDILPDGTFKDRLKSEFPSEDGEEGFAAHLSR